jgi:proton glutamate symport protein
LPQPAILLTVYNATLIFAGISLQSTSFDASLTAFMNTRKAGWLALLLFTVVAILHVVHYETSAAISQNILVGSRWLLVASLIVFAVYKKSLTTWILVAMAMGWKSILYFEVVTTLALLIGLAFINLTKAGVGISIPANLLKELPEAKSKTWQDHIIDIFPENIIKSIYEGNVLPIVIFSVIFGIALALLSEKRKRPMLDFSESLAEAMFKFTNIIMYFAPFGVGAAIAVTVGHLGIDILKNLFLLLITLYLALLAFLVFVLFPVALLIKLPVKKFMKAIREPVSIAFATTSSDSALPKAMENMEKFGVPRKIVSFVIPTGSTVNLDGTTLYLSLASVFVAQAAGLDLSFGQQLLIGLTLMLTSKGVAAVPRASLVILIATASTFGFPLWPIMAIYGIDELMDMARTSVNVIGNTLASCVIARWEGEFDDKKALAFDEKKADAII